MTFKHIPQYQHYPRLGSTNDKLKELLSTESLREGTVIITSHQHDGKGQAGNKWESEANKNLTFSLLLQPDFLDPAKQFYISKIISLALVDTIQEILCGITIKWPNDIYIGDKKIAGILIENTLMGPKIEYSIVGIGLNVNQEVFKSNAPNPVSLKQLSLSNHNLESIKNSLMQNIQLRYTQLQAGEEKAIDKNYFGLLYRNIGKHPFKDENGIFNASIKGVNEMGLLTLQDDQGNYREYAFKEVSFLQA